jgi:hypothetical protein
LGKWQGIDVKAEKYVFASPYNYVLNNQIRAIDTDGIDIIILSAPKGASGAGHAAVPIGNNNDGWRLYSKNGTYGSNGVQNIASGPSQISTHKKVCFL